MNDIDIAAVSIEKLFNDDGKSGELRKILLDMVMRYKLNNNLITLPDVPNAKYYILLMKNKQIARLKQIFDTEIL